MKSIMYGEFLLKTLTGILWFCDKGPFKCEHRSVTCLFKLLPPSRTPLYNYTEWPGTGHSWLWEGIIGGGVTYFVLLLHTVMWNLWYIFTWFLKYALLSHCQKMYYILTPLTTTIMIIVRSFLGKYSTSKEFVAIYFTLLVILT